MKCRNEINKVCNLFIREEIEGKSSFFTPHKFSDHVISGNKVSVLPDKKCMLVR